MATNRRMRAVVAALAVGLTVSGCGSGTSGVSSADGAESVANAPDGSDCAGRDMVIDRDGEAVALQGECGTVLVRANGVQLYIDSAETVVLDGQGIGVSGGQADAVILSGRSGRSTIESVGSLAVRGNGMTVDAREVASVDLTGSGNVLSVEQATAVTVAGNDNTVRAGELGEVEVTGSHNTVEWTDTPVEVVRDTGAQNTLSGPR
ncbi:DUF3060 domain-containing protein [Rhodococcus triatomae]|uniref:DUF3060 domain-containing protein n=1 Tax=Rhodococcus triatomae TaxID=300028 RepID=A0A1G8GVY9_9NOCA|nr:DUF3060 domain-containing protein [Rhodococcus triatomae]QNG20285.1 DUF3060 domain-containing protein [Rhodococcus triatomae]QNG23800.1 DUF3060 domain-containing protein [Rhodococcus triatomae]SDH98519.1 Protein of unknown function [Rhodococcus triatomae]